MWGMITALVSGALMSIQGVFNSAVIKHPRMRVSAGWVQISAFVVCLLMWLFTGRGAVSELWQIEPRYMLTGGVIGAFITYTVIKSFDALGPAKSALLIVVAQILVAYLIEVFGWFGVEKAGFEWRKAIGAAVVACTLLGMAIEKVAYKPLRKAASPLAVLITAIGVSYLLQNVALLIFGANAKAFTSVVSVPALKLADGQINITGETIVTIVSCLIIMAGLMLFINKTKAGQAMLAVSEDKGAAQLMGINVDGTIALTFAIGSGLAAVAGVLLCSAYPSLTPYTGSMPGIKAFVAAVFGGIGSIPGALVGGILLGIIEIFGKAYISSQMADAIVFAVLIVVLLVRPAGLFGKNIQEKV